ncbi:hypothetical protein ACFX2B_045688 [Malus domestica]
MVGSRHSLPSWMTTATSSRVDLEGNVDTMFREAKEQQKLFHSIHVFDANLGFDERSLSVTGAAFVSAILINPFDVAKTRLQAQAAEVPYQGLYDVVCAESNTMLSDLRSSMPCTSLILGSKTVCPLKCNQYKGTLDVLYKVICQLPADPTQASPPVFSSCQTRRRLRDVRPFDLYSYYELRRMQTQEVPPRMQDELSRCHHCFASQGAIVHGQ